MKYVLGIILAFALILPSKSLAEDVQFMPSSATVSEESETSEPGSLTPTEETEVSEPKELAVDDSHNFLPLPWGIAIGGGPGMFSTGFDFFFFERGILYGFITANNILIWTNRLRMIYDFENHQYGFLFQPNLRYLYFSHNGLYLFSAILGPEIGWETKTGFEYGASLRIGGAPGLWAGNYEVGYLVNSKRIYFTVSFTVSILAILLNIHKF
ncbi:MAG: hypothetical protein MJY93_11195 [Fibrobacter sp.]|nr:hypothetical protein [Fibrobacter sp.]